ncbi:hypothetical protein MSPP1_001649 [Malassezia sp. CBS 17886]|nr:hypothetical protein MSPP1_001649 [Malassezia sp. CBS 17886]
MARLPLAPPIRFGTVAFPLRATDADADMGAGDGLCVSSFSECLYRGAYPKLRNLRFLETLHLRTIVSLTPKPIDDDDAIRSWARTQHGGVGVHIVHVRTERPKEESGGLTREGAARAMLELLNREKLPLYVHCLDGVEATSMLVACLRKIQGWSEDSVYAELARGVHVSASRLAGVPMDVPPHLAQFVERYGQPDGVLVPPCDRIPSWLWPRLNAQLAPPDAWNSTVVVQHPLLQIHFQRSIHYTAAQRACLGAVWSSAAGAHACAPCAESTRNTPGRRPHADTMRDADLAPASVPAPADAGMEARAGGLPRHVPHRVGDSLCTPKARPVDDDMCVPPLSTPGAAPCSHVRRRTDAGQMRPDIIAQGSPSDADRTPLVAPKDAPMPCSCGTAPSVHDVIPPMGLDLHSTDERAAQANEEEQPWLGERTDAPAHEDDGIDEEDDYEDEDDPSQVLEALDLEGY